MSDEFADEDRGAVSALRHAIRAEEWTHLAGTGADARGRSHRMRRTRYAATAGTALAVTGVAALVASTFGGGGSPEASPVAGATHTSGAPAAPHVPAKTLSQGTTAPTTPAAPATSAASKNTMASYYDKWKTCPVENLTVGPIPPGVSAPATSTEVWVDACNRIVRTLTALRPNADVSPGPSGWRVPSVHSALPIHGTPGRDEPVPADAIPQMGPAVYRIQDAKGTLELAFHSNDSHESDPPDGGTQVEMVGGLRAWLALPKEVAPGRMGGGEFYVENAKGQDAYALMLDAPAGYTAEDFQALVTDPAFKQMMADNLKEPNF